MNKTTFEIVWIRIGELEKGDIFSFRTIQTPIWWKFIEIKDKIIYYEEIRSKYKHNSTCISGLALKKIFKTIN